MPADPRPNLLFVMADDHAAQALSAYGSELTRTPHIDRLADGGMRFDACFCTNSICTPSRATILTGTYSHVNGVTTLDTLWDARQPTFVTALAAAGYQTAVVGKWHLGHGGIHDPVGFDHWMVLPDQGAYHDPEFLATDGAVRIDGYATDIITDLAIGVARAARSEPTLLPAGPSQGAPPLVGARPRTRRHVHGGHPATSAKLRRRPCRACSGGPRSPDAAWPS